MKKMRPLEHKELLAVLRIARQHSQRDAALLLLTFAHAMRAGESGTLLVSDVNMKDWTIRVTRQKGSLETVESISANSDKLLNERTVLADWLAVRPKGTPYLFPSRKASPLSRVQVYRLFRCYAELAGLPDTKRGVHALKHTLGQRMADHGIDIGKMRVAMGHRMISSTQCYFAVTPEQADEARQVALTARM